MTKETATTFPGSLGAAVAEMGTRAQIRDLYDDYGSRVYDDSTQVEISELRALRRLVRKYPGPILELAAGSGRLTVPMLGMEREVTALELSPSMIDRLHENVDSLPPEARRLLRVHQEDMREFELG